MHPNLALNYPAMAVAFVAAFVFGGLWYGPIAGKPWGKAMGMDMSKKPSSKVMKRAFAIQIVGTCLVVYVLAHCNQVWRPSVWGVGQDQPGYIYGFFGAFFTWLGFYVPIQMNKVAWEMRPWKVFFINTAHDFLNLQIISQILANWR